MPTPLALLLGVVAVTGACWALLVPAGQAPDEPAHMGYAQDVAESLHLPDEKSGRTYSRELVLAMRRSNALQTAQMLDTRPEWSEIAEGQWKRMAAGLPDSARSDGGHSDAANGPNPARVNPPMYYLYSSVAYHAARGSFFDRLYAIRLWSVVLLLVATCATWLFLGELLGPRRDLQLVGAAVVGLQPMATFVSSSVSPDSMLIALFAVAFWLGMRVLRRGLTLSTGVLLGLVSALAVLTKGTSYALVPGVALAVAVGAWRLGPPRLRAALIAGASALTFAVPVGAWLLLAHSLGRSAVNPVASGGGADVPQVGLLDYLWQFYLPKTGFVDGIPGITKLPAYDIWIKTGWGAFGWLEVRFPDPVYVVLAVITVALVAGGLAVGIRRLRRGDPFVALFIVLVPLSLLAGLHWIEWRQLNSDGLTFAQGRYLLPLLPLLGACAAAVLGVLPARLRLPSAGVLLGALFTLQAFALAIVAGRFYA